MLIDKYEPVNLFDLVPVEEDHELAELDKLLDDDQLFQRVKADLARRRPHTLTAGRNSTPVEVTLRTIVVKHLYKWSYEETERFVSDSIVLRQFCRVYLNKVPDDTTLIRWANLIRPETLHALLDHVVTLACRLKVTRGRKLRTDGTVVETNIHHPTDSSLLVDGVRVLSRTIKRAKAVLGHVAEQVVETARDTFRDRRRSARKVAWRIANIVRQRSAGAQARRKEVYKELIRITRATVRQTERVVAVLKQQTTREAKRLVATLEEFLPRVKRVIEQTTRRVFEEEMVPASEKIVSLFEPHTDIIRRGKSNKLTEFGRKIWLDEVERGIVTNYRILAGNPSDKEQWHPSLEHHIQQFGRPPDQASADRGVYSSDNEAFAEEVGVKRVVLPKPGYLSPERRQHERQRWFKRGRRFHNGVEGRISVLKRRYGLDRCLYHGADGIERWVGWGIIAHNLHVIGATLASR